MKTAVQKKDPEIRWYFPIWHHHHSSKMKVRRFDQNWRILVIAGSAASVRITRVATTVDEGWYVDWEVVHSQQCKANGRVIFTSDELQAAFGLSDNSGTYGDWLISRFGAESAEQGKYIRWKDFLNIPCPGTGHDGDPNVSIEINEEIKRAVQQLFV